jgi:hypothetical protein
MKLDAMCRILDALRRILDNSVQHLMQKLKIYFFQQSNSALSLLRPLLVPLSAVPASLLQTEHHTVICSKSLIEQRIQCA